MGVVSVYNTGREYMAGSAQGEVGEHLQPISGGSTYALATALLSAAVPGLGQLVQRRIVSGTLYFAGFLGIGAFAFLTRAPSSYLGLLRLLFILFAYNTVASCDAFFARRGVDERKSASMLLLILFAAALIFALVQGGVVVHATGFALFEIPSTGMQPTIEQNSHVMVDLGAYSVRAPARGDVVIMKRGGTYYAKRLIGLPGETVSISEGVVSINGQPIQEPYVGLGGDAGSNGRYFEALLVPENSYFVLGDNRDVSVDSRQAELGMVASNELVGKALYVVESPRSGSRIDIEQAAPVHGDSGS